MQVEVNDVTRPDRERAASGKPGSKPTWSSGAKTLVGTSPASRSRVWFTVGLGTLNEIYFADVEQANTRSIRFLVTADDGFFSDEMWDADHTVTAQGGVPCCTIESMCKQGRYRIVKEVVSDAVHDAVSMRVVFTPLVSAGLKLYLTVDPHLGDKGQDNDAWVGRYKGRDVLVAQRAAMALAVACTAPMKQASCGYVGQTDGFTLLKAGKPQTDANLAEHGNVAMTAELDYRAGEAFTVSVGCGTSGPEAAQEASTGVLQDFGKLRAHYVDAWLQKQATFRAMDDLSGGPIDMYRVSTAVLETHQSKRFPGGFIASLSLPWGFDRTDKDIGGYHVLWPRDMVETAMGKLASGDAWAARSTLFFLLCTQNEDGCWSQNMFLDGTPHWQAVQMDGTALPILLADQLRREDALDGYDPTTMVGRALRFLLRNGPCTGQDRWEELPGFSPYTMATEVAALLAAADMCEAAGNLAGATFVRETADAWQDSIDEYTYVTGTDLAQEHEVEGYYVRIAPPNRLERHEMGSLQVKMGNQRFGHKHQPAADVVSPDALALVRFGLRAPDDPRMVNTVKVVDATLKRAMTTGAGWVRSSKDGYGEHADGSPYKEHGIGRCWPLLAGERGHYELAAGNRETALELLRTMARQTSSCGMLPEQVWDAPDIPEHMLYNGHPTGSGMPLVWAHAEYIKLLRSLHAGAVWDLPPQTVERYVKEGRTADFQIWNPSNRRAWMASGKDLRIDLTGAATLQWEAGGRSGSLRTRDTGFEVHTATIPASETGDAERVSVEVQPDSEGAEAESFAVRRSQRG